MSLTTKKLFEKQNPQDGECPPWAQKLAMEYAKSKVDEALKAAGDLMFEPHMATLSREDFMNLKSKIEFK
jgi:hypothetical protein